MPTAAAGGLHTQSGIYSFRQAGRQAGGGRQVVVQAHACMQAAGCSGLFLNTFAHINARAGAQGMRKSPTFTGNTDQHVGDDLPGGLAGRPQAMMKRKRLAADSPRTLPARARSTVISKAGSPRTPSLQASKIHLEPLCAYARDCTAERR